MENIMEKLIRKIIEKNKKTYYVLHIFNKYTGILKRVLTFDNKKYALNMKKYYDNTYNLATSLDTFKE